MWVEAGVPVAGLSGSVSGTNIQGSVTGAGDSSYSLAMLLKGPALVKIALFRSNCVFCPFSREFSCAFPHTRTRPPRLATR